MHPFLVLFGGAFAAIALSELMLAGTKLQTGFVKVVVSFVITGACVLAYFLLSGKAGIVAVGTLWSGLFLSWFGVRSHLESSILLRMLFLLRNSPMTAQNLLSVYEGHYGEASRLEELYLGGLLKKEESGNVLTPRGKSVLRIVSFLNRQPGIE